jgi:hypothetical protein
MGRNSDEELGTGCDLAAAKLCCFIGEKRFTSVISFVLPNSKASSPVVSTPVGPGGKSAYFVCVPAVRFQNPTTERFLYEAFK